MNMVPMRPVVYNFDQENPMYANRRGLKTWEKTLAWSIIVIISWTILCGIYFSSYWVSKRLLVDEEIRAAMGLGGYNGFDMHVFFALPMPMGI